MLAKRPTSAAEQSLPSARVPLPQLLPDGRLGERAWQAAQLAWQQKLQGTQRPQQGLPPSRTSLRSHESEDVRRSSGDLGCEGQPSKGDLPLNWDDAELQPDDIIAGALLTWRRRSVHARDHTEWLVVSPLHELKLAPPEERP